MIIYHWIGILVGGRTKEGGGSNKYGNNIMNPLTCLNRTRTQSQIDRRNK